jgi:hypothetical protein
LRFKNKWCTLLAARNKPEQKNRQQQQHNRLSFFFLFADYLHQQPSCFFLVLYPNYNNIIIMSGAEEDTKTGGENEPITLRVRDQVRACGSCVNDFVDCCVFSSAAVKASVIFGDGTQRWQCFNFCGIHLVLVVHASMKNDAVEEKKRAK